MFNIIATIRSNDTVTVERFNDHDDIHVDGAGDLVETTHGTVPGIWENSDTPEDMKEALEKAGLSPHFTNAGDYYVGQTYIDGEWVESHVVSGPILTAEEEAYPVSMRVYRLDDAGSGYEDEDRGRPVLELNGEWVADLDTVLGLTTEQAWERICRADHEQIEAIIAEALNVPVAALWASPTGGDISGDSSYPNLGVTSNQWEIAWAAVEPKGWGWYRS